MAIMCFSVSIPSVGVTYHPSQLFTLFANYSQASRAPTSIELGCADPANPCSLPNALASDPPLQQVVTSTWEAGARGKFEQNTHWSLDGFRAVNHNDILFVASQQLGTGYFRNFGETQREGIQSSVDGRVGRFTAGLDYTFLSATYQSTETFDGTSNNTAGSRRRHHRSSGKSHSADSEAKRQGVSRRAGDEETRPRISAMVANSSSYARGNENNAYQPDGKYYLGPGVSPGYAMFNFQAHYDLTKRLQLGVEVDNLFNRHYYTAAQLATTSFNAQGGFLARPYPADAAGNYPLQSAAFFSPGAPRRAWVELRLKW